MISSVLEKLEASRHLISGADWAIAGAARAGVASAPAAPARRNSLRLTNLSSHPLPCQLNEHVGNMKLAAFRDGTRDGALAVVGRDFSKAVMAEAAVAGLRTLQQLMDDWPA